MCGGAGRRRALRALLLHLNLILAMYAGAMLVTSARLAWDPSTYVVIRELWPQQYRAAVAATAAAGAATAALVHVAAMAAGGGGSTRPHVWARVYVAGAAVTGACEAAAAAWLWTTVARWAGSPDAEAARRLLQLKEQLKPTLDTLAHWLPFTHKLGDIIQEAEEDVPRNGYVAAAALAVYVAAKLSALAAAAALAWRPQLQPPPAYQCEEQMLRGDSSS